jgi:Flp pilus assembly protein TadG
MRNQWKDLTSDGDASATPGRGGILCRMMRSRLIKSTAAATLPMMAASLVPLIGIIGGGVDLTRGYLVKTRLQSACDAGALAARRRMSGNTLTSADIAVGESYFNVNLRNGAWGATNIDVTYSAVTSGGTPTGAVRGDATARVPLTLMRVFWPDGAINMEADCEAQMNVTNNDIMFVLDVTGSMACLTSDDYDTQCRPWVGSNTLSSGLAVTEKANSRMDGLRTAVENFAVTLANATPNSARLRIGFVPYGSGVRVEDALTATDTNTGHTAVSSPIRSTFTYRSRLARFSTNAHVANTPTTNTYWEYYRGNTTPTTNAGSITTAHVLSQANCLNFMNNIAVSGVVPATSPTNNGASAPNTVITYTWPDDNTASSTGNSSATGSAPHAEWGWSGAPVTSGTSRSCRRRRTDTSQSYQERYSFTHWISAPTQSYDATAFMTTGGVNVVTTDFIPSSSARVSVSSGTGGYTPVQLAAMVANGTAFGMTTSNSRWDGCIIERNTGTNDVDTAPTGVDDTKWAPAWPDVTFSGVTTGTSVSNTGSAGTRATGAQWTLNYACPKAARRLFNVTTANLTTVRNYVNVLNGAQTFTPSDFLSHGKTYHDIGMIWGVRLMSPAGMFSSDHGAAPNGRAINRHIIFMTDGEMDTGTDSYSAYGYESSGDAAHNTRFLAACQAAKDRGISVWVVAFAQSLTTELSTCADTGQAFEASSAADLNTMLQTIAQRIAELRLTA